MKKIVLLFFLLKIVTCKDRVIIFYDSLDAKSKKFIGEQLELSLVEKDIELQFVPFGKFLVLKNYFKKHSKITVSFFKCKLKQSTLKG